MTLPQEFLELVGKGKTLQIRGKDYEAAALTIDEFMAYVGMRPDVDVGKNPDGSPSMTYRNKSDEAREMRASAYVLWCSLRKNGQLKDVTFDEFVRDAPGQTITIFLPLITEVLNATAGPLEKKN